MKKWTSIIVAFALSFWSIHAWSQVKPKLTDIQFLQGQPVQLATYGDVTVELKFDRDMNINVAPTINYGLKQTYGLNLPVRGQWENSKLWQGSFTVTNNVPSTGDGEYYFEISGAVDTSGTAMDTTFSQNVKNTTLFICRVGELKVSIDTLDFGHVSAGTSKVLEITLTNTSCADLIINTISTPSPFQILNPPVVSTLKGGKQYILRIRFAPLSRAVFNRTLKITSNARVNSELNIFLTGKSSGPGLILIPSNSLNFGKVQVGDSTSRTVQVINQKAQDSTLNRNLMISNITSTNSEVFRATPTQFTLQPGDTQQVVVKFTPQAVQSYFNYRLRFQSNDSLQLSRFLTLNGDASDETPPSSPGQITATWTYYNGFTNADSLKICWTNPLDPSGIAEIWWKFTRTPIPPANPSDTTQAGGRYILKNGQTCVNFPLLGAIASGRWYFYIWLVDGKGNSGYQNAVQTVVNYDVTPPGIPTIIRRSIAASQWFDDKTSFRLTISIPKDTARGWVDASEVRWKFKAPPNSPTDYSGRKIFTGIKHDTSNFAIPFNSTSLCGENNLYIWLADSAGNSNAANFTFAPYKFDICPPKITRVASPNQNIAHFGQAFNDTLKITDDSGVDTVWFKYRFGGAEAEEPARPATRIGQTDNFVIRIPQAGVTRRGLEYKVFARDILKNEGTGPTNSLSCDKVEGWFPIRVRIDKEGDYRVDSDGRPVPLVAGEDETNYQLFSIPYNLDTNSIAKVLEDDLGPYNQKVWRLFDYQPQKSDTSRWVEGKSARPFEPGRSYFVITRKENIVIDSGPGQTRRTLCPDSIRVYEGWNLIATPFNFPVEKTSLSLINSNSVITLRSFEHGWNIIDVMDPWRGYALYVKRLAGTDNKPMYLIVQPRAAAGRVNKAAASGPIMQKGEWMVQISADAGNVHDYDNWAGVRFAAAPGYDNLELAEPPVIGKYVAVFFSHPEWSQPAKQFSTDFRPVESKNQVWEFEVKTNRPQKWIHLSFALSGDVPAGMKLYLIDETLKTAQNIGEVAKYRFKAGAKGASRKFKIIAGTTAFAREQAGDIALVPTQFEVLQNFPNPFNPETSIRYNLPEPARVSILIIDQLGRIVRTLVENASQNAGYHVLVWDGRDDVGAQVASGLYFFRVISGQNSITRKMILLR